MLRYIGTLLLFWLLHTCAFANDFFNVVATGQAMPSTTITLCLNGLGSTASCQNYPVSAQNLSISTRIPGHTYPSAGIKVNSSSGTASNCAPNNNGYCVFSVSDTSAKTMMLDPSAYAYVANTPLNEGTNYSVSICPVSHDGSHFGVCSTSFAPDNTGTSTLNVPFAIAINPAKTKVYFANYTAAAGACPGGESSIAICPINADGSLGTCTSACDPTFVEPTGIAFSPDGSTLYASNDKGGTGVDPGFVSICAVNHDGSLQPCTTSNGPNQPDIPGANTAVNFGYTSFIGTQTASNGIPYLYTNANADQASVATCLLTDGAIGTCTNTPYLNPPFDQNFIEGVSFNATNTYAYFGNGPGNVIYICSVLEGNIQSCTISDGPNAFNVSTLNFNNGTGVGLAMSSPTGYGYIPNDGDLNSTISICKISSTDGTLSDCVLTPGNNSAGVNVFNGPDAIALKML